MLFYILYFYNSRSLCLSVFLPPLSLYLLFSLSLPLSVILSFSIPSLSLFLSLLSFFLSFSLCDSLCLFFQPLSVSLSLLSLSLSFSRPYLSFYLPRTPVSRPIYLSLALSLPSLSFFLFFSLALYLPLLFLFLLSLSHPCLSFLSICGSLSAALSLSLSLIIGGLICHCPVAWSPWFYIILYTYNYLYFILFSFQNFVVICEGFVLS